MKKELALWIVIAVSVTVLGLAVRELAAVPALVEAHSAAVDLGLACASEMGLL